MKTKNESAANDFADTVTKFVDDFAANATPEEIDRFLERGGADFYDSVVAPEMVTLTFGGTFAYSDETTSEWYKPVITPYKASAADHCDLALAA